MELYRIRQKLECHPLADPAAELLHRLSGLPTSLELRNRRVIIAVPSRGIDRIGEVLGALGSWLRAAGARPAILPAMGSHGGGTPAGQVRQLLALGLGPDKTGLDVLEPSDYRPVGSYGGGETLYLPAEVRDAAALILVNRIKLHTLFDGPIQSGLGKLLAFGLGGPLGAAASHRHADRAGLLPTVAEASQRLAGPAHLYLGVPLVEDGLHQLSRLEVVPAPEILDADQRLLRQAARFHPQLPFRSGAVLIVERMGKDFSGTGMDPHVIGRPPAGKDRADFHQIFVRSLSPGSHGNALGIGYADHTLDSLVRAIDREVTLVNARTSGSLHKAEIPSVHPTDRAAVETALATAGPGPILQIADTLHVAEALATGYSREQLSQVEVLESYGSFGFRDDGRLKHLLSEGAQELAQ